MAAETAGDISVTTALQPGMIYYKLQAERFGDNGVFFNPAGNNRFSLPDHSKFPMYMADSPHTACHEFYQEEKFIAQDDFRRNCMAEIRIMRAVRVFDEKKLAPHLGVAVGDLMGPKSRYCYTQALAKSLSFCADGLIYLSRYTGDPCLVLWSDSTDGNGMVTTDSVTPLCRYRHNGMTAKQILKAQLNIRLT
ncbi:RES family NAD+ phosphorylase [Morganella morganii]|uniref:RES family NAD+ phosphorylase n=1 Tax=Morganella morganii TaxID=582 RepID=UPI002795A1DC|nr:RES family NAD+ phosphorylase [Morganella morganii]WLV39293.1 RES family NAD+ phosphorylase [Morganella morganii]